MYFADEGMWTARSVRKPPEEPEGLEFQPVEEERPRRGWALAGIIVVLAFLASAVAAALYGVGLLVKLQLDRYLGS